ncbi:hypothetical protein EDC39_101105 [Geothermobacter ehrlichii]|uniref:Uncharacterized protein n=1 Tax=Geothermobacter ehrlichii TaxID=213224 RepID=A0A5D3WLD2_9BACT|nr:hypothetical protein [Geothermobacter ehrlichii]TYO99945.1 hypothetical protein EDC39_101105 [Geothermobacter ehrlichii]
MKSWIPLVLLVSIYAALLLPLKQYMDTRPVAVKLGYLPEGTVLRYTVGDQKPLVAEMAVLKVLFYFGSLIEQWQNRVVIPPEYYNMYRMIETAIRLDPYNMDAYYFAQAAFTWEVGHARDVNRLLAYGMKYRTWDWYLPFFRAFNAAYFLKDYRTAGDDMKRAAELSGSSLFTKLAARYFYEAGHNELGIVFLRSMVKKERDPKVKKAFAMRLEALEKVQRLEAAVDSFRQRFSRLPGNLDELVTTGLIDAIPDDPYGGRFYLEPNGKVRSTSSFASVQKKYEHQP